jgi:transposase
MFSLGIDVSKKKLDCALRDSATTKLRNKSVPNTPAGVKTLLAWVAQQGIASSDLAVVMEPTSTYHENAAEALHDAGVRVHLVNPKQARNFALGQGQRGKTDAADCRSLADMGLQQQLRVWTPPPPKARALKSMMARRAALDKDLHRERNRLEKAQATQVAPPVLDSLTKGIEFLKGQLAALDRQIQQHIDGDDDLQRMYKLMLSIDGVGLRVATEFTALMSCNRFESAEQLACYVGLTPQRWESGTSVRARPHISKAGPTRLRKVLYMPAVVAKKCNHHVRELYDRLLQRGKLKMVATVAAMRKLVHLCFGVVSQNRPYDPNHGCTVA